MATAATLTAAGRAVAACAEVVSATGGLGKTFTLHEVARHNTPQDCWVIVRGSVYDVTAWVPKHPGGPLIYVKAGGDCTQLFDSYHPLAARKVLDKYRIGRVQLQKGETLPDYKSDGEFYATLRGQVDKFFKDNKLNPRVATSMYVKSTVIFTTLAASYYLAFYTCQSIVMALFFAAVLGLCMGEVGVSVMHDANHGAYSPNSWVCVAMGATLDAVGASSFMWRQQHVVGHHAYTNVEDLDPDIRVSDPDVRRVTHKQPWQPYQEYQHLYLGLLYGLLALKSVVLDDFKALAEGRIGAVRLSQLTLGEQAVFWGGKALFFAWFVAAPALWSHHGWAALTGLWLLAELCTGWMLAFMFQVAHVTSDVSYLTRDPVTGKVDIGWAESQVATTADFCHGSWFWTHVSGGLNYQVVHHLFPGICHCHYPALAPIVQEVCAKFGMRYTVYPTFTSALGAHFSHLKSVGAGFASKVPSLATVG